MMTGLKSDAPNQQYFFNFILVIATSRCARMKIKTTLMQMVDHHFSSVQTLMMMLREIKTAAVGTMAHSNAATLV